MNPFVELNLVMAQSDAETRHTDLGNPSGSVSQFDLRAPASARREYDKGLQLLMQRNPASAIAHLTKSISNYPSFVSAHNALGCAFMDLGQNDSARDQFSQAIALDDHLPRSHWNLGRAQIALQQYSKAAESIQKALLIEPLNLNLLVALSYVQLLNHDYESTIATAHQIHSGKHQGAAIVHYLAAAAWQGQSKLSEANLELKTFLDEDPDSPAASLVRQTMAQIESQKNQTPAVTITYGPSSGMSAEQASSRANKILQDLREQKQVAESECEACGAGSSPAEFGGTVKETKTLSSKISSHSGFGWTLHSNVDEVKVFFAATDRGKSISDLEERDVLIRDDRKPPAAITGFRNQAQLPLRVGLVLDTSASITSRFSFEQTAASSFLDKIITDKGDLGFVVGFANSIFLVQDLTAEKPQLARAVNQLAPAGGTSLWDAVVFASDRLARRSEVDPVANILIVISDGEDNSSKATLEEAIGRAQRADVIIYSVSTKELNPSDELSSVGNRALRILSERTGGGAFFPGSVDHLRRSLGELQEVIRSRYLISYKPASFTRDGRYRPIEIVARKSGRKLHVYARKGYYAQVKLPASDRQNQ